MSTPTPRVWEDGDDGERMEMIFERNEGLSRSGSRARTRIEDARALGSACKVEKGGISSEADPRNLRTSGSAVSWLKGLKSRASTDFSGDAAENLPPPPPPPGQPSQFSPFTRSPPKSSGKDVPAPPALLEEDLPPEPPPEPPPGMQANPAFGKQHRRLTAGIDNLLNSTLDGVFEPPPPPAEEPPSLPPPATSESLPSKQPQVPVGAVPHQVSTRREHDLLQDVSLPSAASGQGNCDSADRLSQAMTALGVGKRHDGGGGMPHPEDIRPVVAALKDQKFEQAMVVDVCDALEAAVLHSESCLSTLIRVGGLNVLIRNMQHYSYFADIQVSTCRVLQHLVASDSTIAEQAANAGFFEAAADVMQRYKDNAELQSAASPVIELICCHCPQVQGRAATAGLVEALVAAMKAHVDDAEVQETACAALQVLVSSASAGDSSGVISRAFGAGAMNASVSAMQSHKTDPKLQYWLGLLMRGIAHSGDQKMKTEVLSTLHWQGIQVAGL